AELSWDTCLESPSPDQQHWDRSRGRRRPGPERLVAEAKIRQIVAPEPRTLLFAAEVPALAGCLPICPDAGGRFPWPEQPRLCPGRRAATAVSMNRQTLKLPGATKVRPRRRARPTATSGAPTTMTAP